MTVESEDGGPSPLRAGPFDEGLGPAATYFAYRGAGWIAEHLPLRAGDRVGELLGRMFHRFDSRRREIVRRNLKRIAGEQGLDELVRSAFVSYAQYWLETFRLGRYSKQELLDLVSFEPGSVEAMDKAFAQGKGVLLLTGHIGVYDLGVAWVGARGWPFTTVAEVLRPRALYEWFAGNRTRFGMDVIPARPGVLMNKVGALFGKNAGIALLGDRDLTRRGIWVEFFGERTTLPASPALLAVRKKVPVVAGAMYRQAGGFHVHFEEVDYQLTGNAAVDLEDVAQKMAVALERLIRRAPEQWHVFSTNWPSDEPDLPPRGR
ncbi:MAG: lysophospholipid acyltransferase family protein [Actinomycetota bacterium]